MHKLQNKSDRFIGLIKLILQHWPENASLIRFYSELSRSYGETQSECFDKNQQPLKKWSNQGWHENACEWANSLIENYKNLDVNAIQLEVTRNGNFHVKHLCIPSLEQVQMERVRLKHGDADFKAWYADYLAELPGEYVPPKIEPPKTIDFWSGNIKDLEDEVGITAQNDESSAPATPEPPDSHTRPAMTTEYTEAELIGFIKSELEKDLPADAERWIMEAEITPKPDGSGSTMSGSWWWSHAQSEEPSTFVPSNTVGTLNAMKYLQAIHAQRGNHCTRLRVSGFVGEASASVELDPDHPVK